MALIIDRRLDAKNKSVVNRQRFLKRFRAQLKQAVSDAASGRSITEVDKGERVKIPSRDISEPTFSITKGGRRESIHPGNREFVSGDRVPRPSGGQGDRGGKASNTGEGEDDFVFELSRDEFLDLLFEDLELPHLVKKELTRLPEHKLVRAGFTTDGTPTNINVVRSLRGSIARRIAMGATARERLEELRAELAELCREGYGPDDPECVALAEQIASLESHIRSIPFIDTVDLRYNHRVRRPQPSTQAVMFCIMDVSGSMTQERKDLAKRFFILLYLFLQRNYERIEVVFIRHHTVAMEVDEQEFFHSRETGGTVVSSALTLMTEVLRARYPVHAWNIYAAQASDGDNWPDDSPGCREIIVSELLPLLQYFAYVEITPSSHQRLWQEYERIAEGSSNFAMRQIDSAADIYPVFRELFAKETRMSNFISESSEWTFPLLERYAATIGELAAGYGLDTYPNQIEVISAEQMMDAYSSVGMPINYHHWSFGKQFMHVEKGYRRGRMGLAYEIVINSDPCIAYLMEENTLPMQALVIAHACFGHNSFFKGNYLFRTWTSPDAIIDYLLFAKNYVHECEERYGDEEVESLLDSCHALMNQGVDRYKRPSPLSMREEHARQREREAYLQTQVNDLWRTLPAQDKKEDEETRFPAEPQENLLYFVEKNAPLLEPWQREIVRIVRKIAQYFYPQRQTQVMNEGWATFWHYTLLNTFYEQGYCTDGFMLEFLQSHTNVVYQPAYDSQYYSGHLNPYTLGFAMFRDLRRVCERPTEEDRYWFPHLAGTDWLKQADFAMRNFKDESFIAQYLSPAVIRDLKLFDVLDDDSEEQLEIAAIHDNEGYRRVRTALADQYNLHSREPNIQVYRVDQRGDRSLTLRHTQYNRRPLNPESAAEVLKHLRRLWGFTVRLETVDDQENVELVGEL